MGSGGSKQCCYDVVRCPYGCMPENPVIYQAYPVQQPMCNGQQYPQQQNM